MVGGQGIGVAGHDEAMKITTAASGNESTGVFLTRNSRGTGWRDGGDGWVP